MSLPAERCPHQESIILNNRAMFPPGEPRPYQEIGVLTRRGISPQGHPCPHQKNHCPTRVTAGQLSLLWNKAASACVGPVVQCHQAIRMGQQGWLESFIVLMKRSR